MLVLRHTTWLEPRIQEEEAVRLVVRGLWLAVRQDTVNTSKLA